MLSSATARNDPHNVLGVSWQRPRPRPPHADAEEREAVQKDRALIDGQPVEKVDEYVQGGTTADEVSTVLDGVEFGEEYFLKFDFEFRDDPGLGYLRVENDESVFDDEDYSWWDETQTEQIDQDGIEIIEAGDHPRIGEVIRCEAKDMGIGLA